jgi:hypothetical protein
MSAMTTAEIRKGAECVVVPRGEGQLAHAGQPECDGEALVLGSVQVGAGPAVIDGMGATEL